MENKDLLTVGQAAHILDVSPDSVRRFAKEGRLPAIRVGKEGYRLFSRGDVERIAAERVKSKNE